ncbi:MAG: hypothetical protein FJY29_12165 [Betaproteobacteria bacterium]|nr:hypothetical protein [Betaproteobacteria bacterium]
MRHLFLVPLSAILAITSVVACSSDDSSSEGGSQEPAAQLRNDSPQQNQDANKSNPGQQTPVQQTPVQQAPAGFFEATNGANRYLIPANSMVAIQFPTFVTSNPGNNINLPGSGNDAVSEDKLPQVTVAVKDIQGAPVFAAGSRLIGTLKMSAPRAIFNVTGVKYGSVVYNMAASAEVTSTMLSTRDASVTNILLGAAAGTGIAFLIDGLTGDRGITWWAPLIGAAAGGLGAAILFPSVQEVVTIKAGETAVLVPGPR